MDHYEVKTSNILDRWHLSRFYFPRSWVDRLSLARAGEPRTFPYSKLGSLRTCGLAQAGIPRNEVRSS